MLGHLGIYACAGVGLPIWRVVVRFPAAFRFLRQGATPYASMPRYWRGRYFASATEMFNENITFIRRTRSVFVMGTGALRKAEISAEVVDLLFRVRRREVTEPRDRLYGLVALINSAFGHIFLDLDYTACLQDIFTDFSYALIHSSRSLELLTQSLSQTNALTGLPSWVPDFTSRYDFKTEQDRTSLARRAGFRACGKFDGGAVLRWPYSRPNVLQLPGLFVDRIEHVGMINEYAWTSGYYFFPAFLQCLTDWGALCEQIFPSAREASYPTGGSVWHAFCRTMFNDNPPEGDCDDIEDLYASVVRESAQQGSMVAPRPAAVAIGRSIAKRRFLITQRIHRTGANQCRAT